MSNHEPSRRRALGCLSAWSGAAIVWTVVGGVPRALGATNESAPAAASAGSLTFVQISDTHIGFKQGRPIPTWSAACAMRHCRDQRAAAGARAHRPHG